jgi:hypothetical protein
MKMIGGAAKSKVMKLTGTMKMIRRMMRWTMGSA